MGSRGSQPRTPSGRQAILCTYTRPSRAWKRCTTGRVAAQPLDSPDAGIPLRVHPGEPRERPYRLGRVRPGGKAFVARLRRHHEIRSAAASRSPRDFEPSVAASGRILSKVRWDEEKHSNVMGTAMRRIFVRVEPPSVHAPILMRHSVARRVRVWVFLRQRSDLQSLIYELATSAGVQVSFSSVQPYRNLDKPDSHASLKV